MGKIKENYFDDDNEGLNNQSQFYDCLLENQAMKSTPIKKKTDKLQSNDNLTRLLLCLNF